VGIDAAVQNIVSTVWAELLGVAEIGATDRFFDLGGDSMLGIMMIERIEEELGIKFPVEALFVDDSLANIINMCVAAGACDGPRGGGRTMDILPG